MRCLRRQVHRKESTCARPTGDAKCMYPVSPHHSRTAHLLPSKAWHRMLRCLQTPAQTVCPAPARLSPCRSHRITASMATTTAATIALPCPTPSAASTTRPAPRKYMHHPRICPKPTKPALLHGILGWLELQQSPLGWRLACWSPPRTPLPPTSPFPHRAMQFIPPVRTRSHPARHATHSCLQTGPQLELAQCIPDLHMFPLQLTRIAYLPLGCARPLACLPAPSHPRCGYSITVPPVQPPLSKPSRKSQSTHNTS
jgi:hypothetical protein